MFLITLHSARTHAELMIGPAQIVLVDVRPFRHSDDTPGEDTTWVNLSGDFMRTGPNGEIERVPKQLPVIETPAEIESAIRAGFANMLTDLMNAANEATRPWWAFWRTQKPIEIKLPGDTP